MDYEIKLVSNSPAVVDTFAVVVPESEYPTTDSENVDPNVGGWFNLNVSSLVDVIMLTPDEISREDPNDGDTGLKEKKPENRTRFEVVYIRKCRIKDLTSREKASLLYLGKSNKKLLNNDIVRVLKLERLNHDQILDLSSQKYRSYESEGR